MKNPEIQHKALECLEEINVCLETKEDENIWERQHDTIKQALNELKAIKESKPSEAFECLEYIEYKLGGLRVECERTKSHRCDDLFIQEHIFTTIKNYILKAQEQQEEQITRDDLVQIIEDVFGDIDKFLDMIDDNNIPMNFTCIYQDEELYIIDDYANRYVHWYKKAHIGRDFHTDMRTKEELKEFFKRLSKGREE